MGGAPLTCSLALQQSSVILCRASQTFLHKRLGFAQWRKVMNTTFHPYRAPVWSGLKRYFVEWRKRALIRRELRMSSDRQSWEDIIPPTPPAHDV